MIIGRILAVAEGKQAWGYGEVFWEEDPVYTNYTNQSIQTVAANIDMDIIGAI